MDRKIEKLAPIDRPYTSNYPELDAWIHKHGVRCLSQDAAGEDFYEKWIVRGGAIALVEVRSRRRGWEIWTVCSSNRVDATFEDAERRLGLAGPVPPAGVRLRETLRWLYGLICEQEGDVSVEESVAHNARYESAFRDVEALEAGRKE